MSKLRSAMIKNRETEIKESIFPHLVWELADAFHQILVRLPVSSNHLSQNWDHLETVCIIKPEE